MGLFSFLKRQLLKVIQMEEMPANVLVKKYRLEDRDEIMNSSSLVVRPGQVAIFVHKGEICDVFAEGTYKLASENIPVLTKVLSLPTGFDSPIKADVYFVNVRQVTGLKWGTQNPVKTAKQAIQHAEKQGYDVVIIDTAGRLHINEELMNELKDIKKEVKPHEILLVVDAMTGQDAVTISESFNIFAFTSRFLFFLISYA